MAGSVTENVTKLSFASERMQAAERAQNFVVDSSLQTTSTPRCPESNADFWPVCKKQYRQFGILPVINSGISTGLVDTIWIWIRYV